MKMRSAQWGGVAGLLMALLAIRCGGGTKATPTLQCLINSDCKSAALQCSQGYCVKNCQTSQDCPNGERCVILTVADAAGGAGGAAGAGGAGGATVSMSDPNATATGTVCQALEKKTCALNSDCSPLFCALDLQCRNQCKTAVDCLAGNVCTVSGVCVDPLSATDMMTYDPTTNDVHPPAAGGTSGGGGGKSGGGGHTGAGGKSGGPPIACTTPQISFGGVAVGDANPFFTNGTGVRAANQLLIFSSYVGPAAGDTGAGGAGGGSDAGVSVNMVYVQAFDPDPADPGSWKSAGPSAALFPAPDGTNFQVANASIAPTGEIALMFGTGPVNANWNSLYAAFLTTSVAGAANVKYVKTVPLENAQLGLLGAIWSPATQEFILSWEYAPNGWLAKVQKYSPNGSATGGTTSVLTPNGLNGPPYGFGLGVSGSFLGAVYRDASTGFPYLTVLDKDSSPVGSPTQLAAVGLGGVSVQAAGTAAGFVTLYESGGFADEVFVPAANGVVSPPTPADGGDAGMFTGFSVATTASYVQMISDDPAASGGVGAALLETDGATFLYVSPDGSKHNVVTAVSSPKGTWVAITNYHGSFSVSLHEATTHTTKMVASGCTP
jgi:hypothetical protein